MITPTIDELKESLLLQLHHRCCDDAWCLRPPTRGTDEQFVDARFVDIVGTWVTRQIMVDARDRWTIDMGDEGHRPEIQFCPFCGERLAR